jgi:hypothetical protein
MHSRMTTSGPRRLLQVACASMAILVRPSVVAVQSQGAWSLDPGSQALARTSVAPARMVLDLGAAAAPSSLQAHRGEVGTWRIGASLGLDVASGFAGFVLRPHVSYTLLAFGPNPFFDLAGDIGQQPVCAEQGAKGS